MSLNCSPKLMIHYQWPEKIFGVKLKLILQSGTCHHGSELSSFPNTILSSKVHLIFKHSVLNITGNLNFTSKFNQTFFTEKLIREQAADGSWHQLVDLNRKEGCLDATIFNCIFNFLTQIGI